MEPLARWHRVVATNDFAALDDLIDESAVFVSPALHTPQRGRALVCKYLRAAMTVLNNGSFRYTDEWTSPSSAVLQFEVALGDVVVNGVDIITWNAAGSIVELKVMIRPLKALTTVVGLMAAQLGAA
jgi:SnoaL-like domain